MTQPRVHPEEGPGQGRTQLFSLTQKMGEFGIRVQTQGIDWATAVGRKDRLVNSYLAKKGEALEERNVAWIRESVRFLDPHTLQADSRRVTATKVIVATGSAQPPIDSRSRAHAR